MGYLPTDWGAGTCGGRQVRYREVKLGQVLTSLIERGGYSRNRKRILEAVDVSPAALSQYARDQTRPSFQKLVALADFFGVSLDYLVYGEATGTVVDHGPLARYVDHALADVQARGSRHSALVARIGRVLADRVDGVAKELAASPTAAREGLLQDDEVLRLESYCLRADIVTISLEFDVIAMPGGDAAAGTFLQVVANNLSKGCRYRFLVPTDQNARNETVSRFRDLLTAQAGGDHVNENCAFRGTLSPLLGGAGLYHLDVDNLAAEEPALFAQVGSYVDDEWIGYLIRPNTDSNSDMIMNGYHVKRARATFEASWSAGTRL